MSTFDHAYTFRSLPRFLSRSGVGSIRLSYELLFRLPCLPRGTYLFTDFDRLSPTELEITARVQERLRGAGLKVLNDPRRFLPRDALLKRLYREGVNRFTCHHPVFDECPDRFPVFLRTISGHRGVLSDLLQDPAAAKAALEAALDAGYPLRDLLFVEYAAEWDPETGGFHKHSAFKVGDRIIRANTVNEGSWMAKHGEPGMATPAQYRAERIEMDAFPHEEFVRRVFAAAGLDFGRIDFGIVDGRPQAYEVNSNPYMRYKVQHENADRCETIKMLQARLAGAIADLAEPTSRWPVSLRGCFRASKNLLRGPCRL